MAFAAVPVAMALFASTTSCTHHSSVQLEVVSVEGFTGSPCPTPSPCFEVRIRNVGSATGSGHCEIPYFEGPVPASHPMLRVDVANLAPGKIATKFITVNFEVMPLDRPRPCVPGVES